MKRYIIVVRRKSTQEILMKLPTKHKKLSTAEHYLNILAKPNKEIYDYNIEEINIRDKKHNVE